MQLLVRLSVLVTLILCTTTASAQSFRVVSSNLWGGYRTFSYTSRDATTDPSLARSIAASSLAQLVNGRTALIALQEVDDRTPRSGGVDVAQVIDNAMGSGWVNRFGGVWNSGGGSALNYGNAVVTNAPITKTQYWSFAHDPNNTADYGNERRGAVATKHLVDGKNFWFVSLHLDTPNDSAMRQVWQLMGKVKTFDPDTPVIVAGDFNIKARPAGTGNSELTYHHLADVFDSDTSGFESVCIDTQTSINRDAWKLDGQIDFVFVYDPHNRLSVDSCILSFLYSNGTFASDHASLVADFHWN